MQIISGLDNLEKPSRPAVVAIGNFDGVHLGHQAILRRVAALAREHGFRAVVLTFECHPLRILAPKLAPGILMPLDRRLDIMGGLGIDEALVARCVPGLLSMQRDDFIRDVLVGGLDAKFIIEGPNFRFGADRTGDIDYLIRVGPDHGFQAIKIEPAKADLADLGVKTISSSLVRKLVAAGRVDLARRCLGRPYELVGPVITGFQRGRTIGFPTANLDVGDQVLPENGVYAAQARIDQTNYLAAVVVGPAPTFEQYQVAVEAFVLDYTGDVYGKTISLPLYRRLRDIIKFSDSSELVRQIRQDVESVRQVLAQEEIHGRDANK